MRNRVKDRVTGPRPGLRWGFPPELLKASNLLVGSHSGEAAAFRVGRHYAEGTPTPHSQSRTRVSSRKCTARFTLGTRTIMTGAVNACVSMQFRPGEVSVTET